MKSNLTATALTIVGLVGLAGCAWFVWPTPFEYTHKGEDIWRVNRFSGIKEVATSDGWRTEKQVQAEIEDKLKAEEGKKADEEKSKEEDEARKIAPRDLTQLKIGESNDVTATCSISYSDDSLKYIIVLKPYAGELQRAVEDPYVRHTLTVGFVDGNGFKVEDYPVPLSSFSRTVEEGKSVALNYSGVELMSKEKYLSIQGWNPQWNW